MAHLSERQSLYRDLHRQARDLSTSSDADQRDVLVRLIGMWEHTAAGVTGGVLDLELLNKMTGSNILATYREFATFIRQRRRENQRIYDQLELLIDKLLAMQMSDYLVTRSAVKRMREFGLTKLAAREVTQLRHSGSMTYTQLVSELIRRNVESDQTLVMAFSRVPSFKIQPATDHDLTAVVQLFTRVQRHTLGSYPPKHRTEAEGGIEAWLMSTPPTERFLIRDRRSVVAYIEVDDLAPIMRGADSLQTAYWSRALFDQDLVEDDSTIVPDRTMVIKRLVVDPEHGRNGMGRILLRHALGVVQLNYGKLACLVVLDKLTPAIALYESEGATFKGEFKGWAGDRLLTYVF